VDQIGVGEPAMLRRMELFLVFFGIESTGVEIVDRLPVGMGRHRHVVGALRPPLDLERIDDTRCENLVDMGGQIHIPGIHDIGPQPLFLFKTSS